MIEKHLVIPVYENEDKIDFNLTQVFSVSNSFSSAMAYIKRSARSGTYAIVKVNIVETNILKLGSNQEKQSQKLIQIK